MQGQGGNSNGKRAKAALPDSSIKNLVLKGCGSLKKLDCSFNKISALNLAECKNLTYLNISSNSFLTSPNTAPCAGLETLVSQNNQFPKLDLTKNPRLKNLDINGSLVKKLDVKGCRNLSSLKLESTPISYFRNSGGRVLKIAQPQGGSVLMLSYNCASGRVSLKAVMDRGSGFLGWKNAPAKSGSKNPLSFSLKRNISIRPVYSVQISGIQLPAAVRNMAAGQTYQLKAKAYPKTAKDKTLVYTSSNPQVATVDGGGLITAVKQGRAVITVTAAANKEVEVKFTVAVNGVKAAKVRLNRSSATMAEGASLKLRASVLPQKATFKKLVWASSDESTATVNSKGVVSALSPGRATITATTQEGIKAACTIRVE